MEAARGIRAEADLLSRIQTSGVRCIESVIQTAPRPRHPKPLTACMDPCNEDCRERGRAVTDENHPTETRDPAQQNTIDQSSLRLAGLPD